MHGHWIAVILILLLAFPSTGFCRGRAHLSQPKKVPRAVKSPAPVAKVPQAVPETLKAAVPLPPDTPVADKWALIIGISKFKDPTINLKYPAKDARDLYNFLVSEGNFAPDHVKLLLNEQATRGKILSELGDKWLPRVANPNDLVLIYISSHGSPSG